MLIPLKVQNVAGGPKPVLLATVRVKALHVYGAVLFVVDTGSPQSAICEKDSLRLQVPFNRIHKSIRVWGIGGSSVEAKPMKNAIITFRDDNNKLVHKTIKELYACRTTKRNRAAIGKSRSLPSILGVDFLEEHRFKLVFDPVNLNAYLEQV